MTFIQYYVITNAQIENAYIITKQGFDFYDCLFRTKTLLHSQHSPITYIYRKIYRKIQNT